MMSRHGLSFAKSMSFLLQVLDRRHRSIMLYTHTVTIGGASWDSRVQRIITRPAATYFMRAGSTHYREGILNGALLVVDASLSPCDGSLLVCADEGEFCIKRYRIHPEHHLENGKRELLRQKDEMADSDRPVFGVITYIINDARTGEFDDCPVM